MDVPETRYAEVGDTQVAYQAFGEGPDLVYSTGFLLSHVDYMWDLPDFARFLRRLATFSRVTMFDRRGTGASDRLPPTGVSTWESWVEDLNAVLGILDVKRPSIVAGTDAGPMAMLFAATYPERVSSLVLTNTGARAAAAPDYPFGVPDEMREALAGWLESEWGKTDGVFPGFLWPERANDPDFRRWLARVQRAVMTPKRASELWRMEQGIDVRRALPLIQAPTLLIGVRDWPLVPPSNLEYLAEHIKDSKIRIFDGKGTLSLLPMDEFVSAIEEHVTGEVHAIEPDRVLATVLFTDIVKSTEHASRLGDRRWHALLDRHDEIAAREVARFAGRLVKTTGDGILATFDGPARAVRCASGLCERLRQENIEIRSGLHAGEVEIRDGDVGGIAVHIAARVMALAGPSEVLVSSTVKGLVAGSGLTFTDRGMHTLAGVADDWQLHALASAE